MTSVEIRSVLALIRPSLKSNAPLALIDVHVLRQLDMQNLDGVEAHWLRGRLLAPVQ